MSLDQLKVELKTWEHEFQDKFNRPPTKDDIKRLPEIKKMYKQYQALKRQKAEVPKVLVTPSKTESSPKKTSVSKANEVNNVELGPTPQIYGKAISIFEMKLSPVKKALNFDNPTTAVHEDSKDESESIVNTPNSSSFKKPKQPVGSKYYGPNSPLKLEGNNILLGIKSGSPLKMEAQENMDFKGDSISCNSSPLIKRPLTKSLLELAKEHEKFTQEFKQNDGQLNPFSQEGDEDYSEEKFIENEGEDPQMEKKERKKRRKVIRRLTITEESKIIPKDISKELIRLKKQQVNEFFNEEITEEAEVEEQEEASLVDKDKEEIPGAGVKPRKNSRKYNLVSNNFRRLKLPRNHSARRRWRR